jgi:hypothetical protein
LNPRAEQIAGNRSQRAAEGDEENISQGSILNNSPFM